MPKSNLLRVCASCEWLFKAKNYSAECPNCGFGSYAASDVYGRKAYRYVISQKPWIDRKLGEYEWQLRQVVDKANKEHSKDD